ncbi:MAG TPA: tetratricopeptide repeat protein [Terracidiphilus sp.]|nr:tetratricopeptide repeat protein [Terracidiphilus sp.]
MMRSAAAALCAVMCLAACARSLRAQNADDETADEKGRILLVLPFDNRTGQPSLEWIREAAPEILSSRFTSAGFAPMSRADRMYALDHLGLPESFQPSRASALKLAQTLDADSIVVGSYITDGGDMVAEARVVDVPHLKMSAPVTARGPMRSMIDIFDSLAWKLTKAMDPGFSGSEETFIAAGKDLRLGAFEQYIRGITEPDQGERIQHLQAAVKLSPNFAPAWLALGREDYAGQNYAQAADAFAKVGRNDASALEAGFYRGLSLLFSGQYPQAEAAFAGVARILPLAEVLNNEGVAQSRQRHDGTELFRKAIAADPKVADYHFNLAVSLNRRGLKAEALTELQQSLKLRPNDSEAQDLLDEWKSPPAATTATADEEHADPLERIVRTFDARAFRQAAMMMDKMEEARLAELPAGERAEKLSAQAHEYLDRGLILEAERLYQQAVKDDNSLAAAHAGLAEVRERAGDAASARKEAEAALALSKSAEAYLVLGRIDLAAGNLDEASRSVAEALQLDPRSREAQDLKRQIDAKAGK